MKDLKEGVEELGVQFEQFRRTPMESRVFAYLLLSEPPYRSFDDIVAFLNSSKSAVSNALTSLQKEGTVTYKTFSGDRKRYFMLSMDTWYQKLLESTKGLTAFNNVLSKALVYREGTEYPEFNAEIQKLLDFQIYIGEEVGKAVQKWLER